MTTRPASLTELFVAFMRLALQGFGGVLPWAHRTLVEERGWLTREDFVELLTLAQTLPGPNVINVAVMVGDRWFGWRGSVVAVAGLVGAPALIVLALAIGYARLVDVPQIRAAVGGMAAVAAGLVIATGLKLAVPIRRDWHALAFAAAAFAGVGLLRWPLPWVLAGLGPAAVAVAWWREHSRRKQCPPNIGDERADDVPSDEPSKPR